MDPRDQRIADLEAQLVAKDAMIDEQLAAKDVVIEEQRLRIEQLEREMADLKQLVASLMEKLGQNSSNSHLPPSSDGPGGRASTQTTKGKSKRKRGGQRGHRGHKRGLLPVDQVDHLIDLFPEQCENCWSSLPKVPDPKAARFQTTEVPPICPKTDEYRRHAVTCACGYTTRAKCDAIPTSPFGPRLMSLISLFTGVYHLSRRQTVTMLHDVLGVEISLGAVSAVEARVSDAIEPAVDEAWSAVEDAAVKHADATSWLQSGKLRSLWTIATTVATVFKVVLDGSAETVKPLFGACKGILVSDRATVFSFWSMKRRQICWAHLLRKFISFSERDGPAQRFGQELLDYTALIFTYWQDYKDGKTDKKTFRDWMTPVRAQIEDCLKRAAAANIDKLSGSCTDMLAHQEALWTFVERDGVEPTNNHAERELRAFVLWRKRSFGTQSNRGNLYAERIMTVAHTARKQNKNVLAFLTACCEARLANTTGPSLLAAQLAAA